MNDEQTLELLKLASALQEAYLDLDDAKHQLRMMDFSPHSSEAYRIAVDRVMAAAGARSAAYKALAQGIRGGEL